MYGNKVWEDEAISGQRHLKIINETAFDTPTATDIFIGWGQGSYCLPKLPATY